MSDYRRLYIPGWTYFFTLVGYRRKSIFADSPVGRNKPVRAVARTGVSGKHLPNSPETPPRATRLDALIPAYA
ncbi:MAG: hypothetical protein ACXW01_12480 [Methylobacter sp.]